MDLRDGGTVEESQSELRLMMLIKLAQFILNLSPYDIMKLKISQDI